MQPPGKRTMKTRRTRTALLIVSLTLVPPAVSLAATLGEITYLSAIGSPLRIEIDILDGQLGDIGNCLRIASAQGSTQGLPVIDKARISATTSGGRPRIVISSSTTMMEPAAQLTLVNSCESRLRRDYTLLFPYPVVSPLPAPAPVAAPTRTEPPRPAAKRKQSRNARIWLTAPGDSLTSLASALYPNDESTRAQFVRETARANPELFPDAAARGEALPAGTRIVIPNLSAAASSPAPQQRRAPNRTATEPAPPATDGQAPTARQDRLVVAAEQQARPSTSLTQPAPVASSQGGRDAYQREQEIVAAIDRSIVNQMELLARIKELEQIQVRLMEQASQIGVMMTPAAAPTPVPATPAAALPAPIAAPTPAAPPAPAAAPADQHDGLLSAALAVLAGAIAAALIIRSRRRDDEQRPESVIATEFPPLSELASIAPPESQIPPRPAPTGHVAGTPPIEWDAATPSAFDPRLLAPIVTEDELEEHDSAIELADIMMSFGRVHGAAETLAEFIRSNPKQAVTPWLKLLDVYRAAGLRAEFDGLARQLNKTFNVKAVTWNNFDAARSAPDTLENMPHLIAALQKSWATIECQSFLHHLLRDNRDGTREGFPLNVIDEILCLSAVLEHQLGHYKPPAEESPPEDGAQPASPTLPPA